MKMLATITMALLATASLGDIEQLETILIVLSLFYNFCINYGECKCSLRFYFEKAKLSSLFCYNITQVSHGLLQQTLPAQTQFIF
jgi:hypothetical protein